MQGGISSEKGNIKKAQVTKAKNSISAPQEELASTTETHVRSQ